MSAQDDYRTVCEAAYGDKKNVPLVLKLEWDNFYSFDKESFINFEEIGKLQIMGPNASGKSSIFNILTFALFGVKAGYINNPLRTKLMLCNKNTRPGYVKCLVLVNNQKYIIQRNISRKFVIETEICRCRHNSNGASRIIVDESALNLIDRDDYYLYFMAKQQRLNIAERSPTELSRIFTNSIYAVTSNPTFVNIKMINDHRTNNGVVIGNFKINFDPVILSSETTKEIHSIAKVFKSLCEIFVTKEKSALSLEPCAVAPETLIDVALSEIPHLVKTKHAQIITEFSASDNKHDLVNLFKLAEFYSGLDQRAIDNYADHFDKVQLYNDNLVNLTRDTLILLKNRWNVELAKVSHPDHKLQIDLLPLKVFHNDVEFPVDVISGYQRFILDLTFRVVSGVNILLIDEGFGCCDSQALELLTRYLCDLSIPIIVNTNIKIPGFAEIEINKGQITFGQNTMGKSMLDKILSGEIQHEDNVIGRAVMLLPSMRYSCRCCCVVLYNRASAIKHMNTAAHIRMLLDVPL
jgi:ABC-type uncharacterized transport system ATPase component